jgi:hypothetical protein
MVTMQITECLPFIALLSMCSHMVSPPNALGSNKKITNGQETKAAARKEGEITVGRVQ